MSKWKLPFIANIPVEKEREIDNQIKAERAVEEDRTKKIRITYNNQNSGLRKVADYLLLHINKEISYEELSKELNLPESSCKMYIGDLNFFNGFPMTMIPIPKKKGFIQSVLENEENYEKWDRKKLKTITSMSVVKDKAEKSTKSKRRYKKKEKEQTSEITIQQSDGN